MISSMWMTFWPDVLVALIGASLTVAIAFGTYILNLRRNERRALIALVHELYRRRAFTGKAVALPGARDTPDYMYCNASVLSMKDEIRHARDSVREIPELQRSLAEMTKSCNLYLEMAERDPDSCAIGLMRLRDDLRAKIKEIASHRPGVPELEPGGGAYD